MNIITAIKDRTIKTFKLGDIVEVVEVFNPDDINLRDKFLGQKLIVSKINKCSGSCRGKCVSTHKTLCIHGKLIENISSDFRLQGICSCYCHMVKVDE